MSKISKLAVFMLTTIAVAIAGTGPALARPDQGGVPAPIAPASSVTEQVTTTAASPLWQFVVVAIIAATVTAIVAVALTRLARRDRPRQVSLQSA